MKMSSFSETHNMEISFASKDIRNISIDGGSYSHRISITTADGKNTYLKFEPKGGDMKAFIEALITTALKVKWDDSYPSGYWYPTDENVTLEQIASAMDQQVPDADA
jgi:hypothetical protein